LFKKFINSYKYCNVYILIKYEYEKIEKDFRIQLNAFQVHNLLRENLKRNEMNEVPVYKIY